MPTSSASARPRAHIVVALLRRVRREWPVLKHTLLNRQVSGDAPVALSLTSYGDRIQSAHYAIESIVAGSARPRELYLWLDSACEQQALPAPLRRLQRRGLRVRYFADCGPHMKYYPYVASTPPGELALVTADDDVLYPRYWLRVLLDAAQAQPEHVHCFRAKVVQLDAAGIGPYIGWQKVTHRDPSFLNFATGVSGVLYPKTMVDALRAAGMAFLACCPRADDIWLHAIALRSRHRVRQVNEEALDFDLVPRMQLVSLQHDNVLGGQNDRQIAATYTAADIDMLRRCPP